MSDRFTNAQRAAIEARGKTIVSASAGSGKTTVMIEKIVRLIKSGVSVDSVLAVTFTKKAASQMKEKLSKELIEEINKPDCPKEKQTLLKAQLADVPSADISTIHSFCAKLIRTHFFAAGTDNAFRVIASEDAEGTALKNQALDELFDEGYEEKEEEFSHLLSVYWRKKSDNALRAIFNETYEQLRIRADYREYLERTEQGYTLSDFQEVCKDLKARFDEKCRYYLDLLEDEKIFFQMEEEQNAGSGKTQLALIEELATWLEALTSAPDYFSAATVIKPKFTANRSSKKDSQTKARHVKRVAFLKERIVKVCELTLKSEEEERTAFLRSGKTAAALAKYLLRFDEKYSELKRERGVLDYNDLEHKALKLLSDPEIVSEMREKYKYVFVDEYQDVNSVQESIVSLLAGENLFLVGDVKQAIYGFRGSKSSFFAEKQKQFECGEGQNLFLTHNFRSSDAVLNLVNSQFSLLMTPRVSAVDYARDSYMERGGRYALNDGRAEIHFFGKEEKEPLKKRGVYSVKERTEKKRTEQSRVAKTILSIIEKERGRKYYDPDAGEWKQVRYGDIAILSRKKQGQIAKTVASLAEEIPVTATASVNICEYAEIKTLIDILQLLDNAEQDVPLCSALLSPMGNMTADELAEVRLAYPSEKWFRSACKAYANEKDDRIAYKLKQFYSYYQEVRKLCTVLDAGEILTKILSETRMETGFLSRENGIACVRRIHRFIEEAAGESLCVRAFLQKLKDLEFKIEYSENGGEDSVKVLTMHASKGLEYPIVIVDNLSAGFTGGGREEVFVEEKYGLAPRAFDTEKMLKSSTLLRRLHEEKEEESELADALNLYYVALTRAKFGIHLLFEEQTPMADPKYARSFADLTDFSVWEEYFVCDDLIDLPKQERTALVFNPDEELTKKIMRAFTWKYTFTGYEDLPVKSSATRLLPTLSEGTESDQPLKKEEILLEMESEGVTNTTIGLAYHAFLEIFDFSNLFDGAGTRVTGKELQKTVLSAYEKFSDKDLLSVEKLVEILSNPVFYSLRGKTLYKERQFLVSLPVLETYANKEEFSYLKDKEDGEEMLFQGAIDLLAEGEEETWIIDYKYSKGGAEYLKNHYKPQLDLYKKAVAKITGKPLDSIRCRIVNIFHGFEVDMD